MILDKRTVLEAAARGYCTPTNSHKELDAELLTAVVDEILRALAAKQPENSQQVGIVQVLPLVPQPSTVTTVTPDPVAQEVKIKDASLSRTPETDAIDATADQNYGTDMYSDMLGHARRKEREVAYWKQEFYRVEKMVESEHDRVEELERQLAAAEEEGPALPEGNEEFSQREAKRIVNSADAQCFRWLLKHHSGFGKAMAGVGMRCWIGGIEFIGDDVATAILDAIDREEAAAPSGGGGKA